MITCRGNRKRTAVFASAATTLLVAGAALARGDDESQQSQQHQQTRQQTTAGAQQGAQGNQDAAAMATGIAAMDAERVKDVQRQLASRGLYQGSIDGIAGPKTQAALRNFQTQQGMTASGELDARTADALGVDAERQPVRGVDDPSAQGTAGAGQQTAAMGQADEGQHSLAEMPTDRIQSLQQRLQELGHYRGTVDGVLGPQTRGALQRYFQQQAQLASRGMVTDSALQSLGLQGSMGSPTGATNPTDAEPAPTTPSR